MIPEQDEPPRAPVRSRDTQRRGAACLSCRRQKIRCTMPHGPPCVRCGRRGLTCQVEGSSQLISDMDSTWRWKMERELSATRRELQALSEQCTRLETQTSVQERTTPEPRQLEPERTDSTLKPADSRRGSMGDSPTESLDQHWQVVLGPESLLGDIPGSCVSQVPGESSSGSQTTTQRHKAHPDDIVLKGIVPKDQLQVYFDVYLHRFDHFLYRILGNRHTLESMQASSPLLTAAICVIPALHTPSNDFRACYDHFLSLVERLTFSRDKNMDDVLGLVLGAYWLNGVSSTLAAAAVRTALDCQLHRSIGKALEGDMDHYLRTRLYYLVFVCDHHYSVIYGRPPLTKRCDAIRTAAAFCKSVHATSDDLRITFQIEFWALMEEIWDAFGTEVGKRLDQNALKQLSLFGIRLETLRAEWVDRFESSPCVGNYASKGSAMYYHFAKLYLYTHALRGITRPAEDGEAFGMFGSVQLEHAVQEAIGSATATIRTVIADKEIQSWLNGFHSYYHMMVAFAAVFLLKACRHFGDSPYYDKEQIRRLLQTLIILFTKASSNVHPSHWLIGITRGIKILLDHTIPVVQDAGDQAVVEGGREQAHRPEMSLTDEPWGMEGVWTGFDFRDFDFLTTDTLPDNFPTAISH